MPNPLSNRKARREQRKSGRGRAKRIALTGVAATTASALGLGLGTPQALAAEPGPYYLQAPTTGPLVNLLPALGIGGFNLPVIGNVPLIPTAANVPNLYRGGRHARQLI